MSSHPDVKALLIEVRAYLARQAHAEDIRNEAAWESGSDREERDASEALIRLDEALRQLNAQECLGEDVRASKDEHTVKGERAHSRGHERVRLHPTELAA